MTAHRVECELLGQKFTIRSEAAPEYVRELVDYIEGKLKEVGGADPIKRLGLAALVITDELFRVRAEQARAAGDVNARVDTLLKLLAEVMPPPAKSP
ncbi:MAG: cell division protein ZapA [Candidatus Rokubacteria bacterium]|nr:cell division protein ZapA [Candidatus Rokubacteria bacterium]